MAESSVKETTTRGEQMLALRRSRMAASYPFFRGGFRPFFFGGTAWALIALALWLSSALGGTTLPAAIDPLAWHRHEMLFGFVGAVVTGFFLTAVPNWTGRLPIAGWPLASLFGLWVAARLALLFSATVGLLPAAVLDVGFFFAVALLSGREVLEGNNSRNLPVVGLLLMFGTTDALDYLAISGRLPAAELGWQIALAIIVILISLIGGRIIPSFTRNWLSRSGKSDSLPTQPGPFDLAVLGMTAVALFGWISGPSGTVIGWMLAAAALLQAIRLSRWRGYRAWSNPLVLILHVGYAWLPAGLALLALSEMAIVQRSAAIHALTAGAMATMILAVMTRASLGHTGRDLRANGATVTIYVLVSVGAVLRVIASLQVIDYRISVEVAGIAWGAAMFLFLVAYARVLWTPRLGE